MSEVSGIETYTLVELPKSVEGLRASRMLRDLSMEERSWMRRVSLVCLIYSAGFKTTTTAAVRIARIPMTMRSSTRVKEASPSRVCVWRSVVLCSWFMFPLSLYISTPILNILDSIFLLIVHAILNSKIYIF